MKFHPNLAEHSDDAAKKSEFPVNKVDECIGGVAAVSVFAYTQCLN